MIGCGNDDVPSGLPKQRDPGSRGPQRGKQVDPPLDLRAPPADASKTTSGMPFKRLKTAPGAGLQTGQRAVVRYTGWRQRTGETFVTTRGSVEMDPATAAPAFREALSMLRQGERVILWAPPGTEMPEPVVYEIELIDVVAPSPVVPAPGPR